MVPGLPEEVARAGSLPVPIRLKEAIMKKVISAVCCLLIVVCVARAGENDPVRRGQGYVFFAPGGATSSGYTEAVMHVGGGVEGLLYKGLGIGAEIGYLYPTVSASSGVAVVSLNGLYQFGSPGAKRKVVPFITGGWSMAIRDGMVNGANVGGGLNYWFTRRMGLRLEFRDHFVPSDLGTHIWQARVGLTF